MAMVMAAMKTELIAAVLLNDAGPEVDPAGLRRIVSYSGKLPRVSTWAEAASQAKSVYGSALPGLSDAQWLEYARQGYREDRRRARTGHGPKDCGRIRKSSDGSFQPVAGVRPSKNHAHVSHTRRTVGYLERSNSSAYGAREAGSAARHGSQPRTRALAQ